MAGNWWASSLCLLLHCINLLVQILFTNLAYLHFLKRYGQGDLNTLTVVKTVFRTFKKNNLLSAVAVIVVLGLQCTERWTLKCTVNRICGIITDVKYLLYFASLDHYSYWGLYSLRLCNIVSRTGHSTTLKTSTTCYNFCDIQHNKKC